MENKRLNLIPSSYLPEVHLSQYDKGRILTFKLMDGASEYTIPSGATITVKATKPSGLGFVEACTFANGMVTLVNTETMSNEYGRFPAELSIVSGGNTIGTSNFTFNVEKSPHPEGTIDGDAEAVIPELTLLVERVEEIANSIINSTAQSTTITTNTERSAEGLKCYTRIYPPQDMFMDLVTDYGYKDLNDKAYIRVDFFIPSEYRGKVGVRWIGAVKVTGDMEVTDANRTHGGDVKAYPYSGAGVYYVFGVGTSSMTEGQKTHIRFVIDVYDDEGNIERKILSSQVTLEKTTSGLDIKNTPYSTDEDSITYGFLYMSDGHTVDIDDPSAIAEANIIGSFTFGITGSGSTYSAPNGIGRVVPWSAFGGEDKCVVPTLRIGSSRYIVGSCAFGKLPNFILASAVTSGQTFCLDGLFYKATQNISAGGTVQVGTNAEAVEQFTI